MEFTHKGLRITVDGLGRFTPDFEGANGYDTLAQAESAVDRHLHAAKRRGRTKLDVPLTVLDSGGNVLVGTLVGFNITHRAWTFKVDGTTLYLKPPRAFQYSQPLKWWADGASFEPVAIYKETPSGIRERAEAVRNCRLRLKEAVRLFREELHGAMQLPGARYMGIRPTQERALELENTLRKTLGLEPVE